jgi:DNA-binding GntR family transcriptional regulator
MPERLAAVELDIALDRGSPLPLYYQLANAIETAIREGRLAPGDRLENEVALTTRLGLARPTARQAIQELVKKGLLVRKRGVGTQVVHSPISRETRLTSLYDDLSAGGHHPTTKVLDLVSGPPETDVREAVGPADASEHAEFVKVRRLRSSDGVPLAILTNHLPARLEISAAELVDHGLYETLRRMGVNIKIAHQSVGARLLTEEEAQLLEEETPAACLTMERTVYDDTGRFVELGQHVYRSSLYELQNSLIG